MEEIEKYAKENRIPIMQKDGILYLSLSFSIVVTLMFLFALAIIIAEYPIALPISKIFVILFSLM